MALAEKQKEGELVPQWLSTHPSHENRAKTLEAMLPEVSWTWSEGWVSQSCWVKGRGTWKLTGSLSIWKHFTYNSVSLHWPPNWKQDINNLWLPQSHLHVHFNPDQLRTSRYSYPKHIARTHAQHHSTHTTHATCTQHVPHARFLKWKKEPTPGTFSVTMCPHCWLV